MAARTTQETESLTPAQALAFVERQGVVCEGARRNGIPSLVDEVAGEAVCGNWWSHPRSKETFATTRAVRDSAEVLVCRIVGGKITLVHRRLWPALVRIADRFDPARLARLHEVHTASGKHAIQQSPFPDWVPTDVLSVGRKLSKTDAVAQLQSLFSNEA